MEIFKKFSYNKIMEKHPRPENGRYSMNLQTMESDVLLLRMTSGKITNAADSMFIDGNRLENNAARLSKAWTGNSKDTLFNGFAEERAELQSCIKELNEICQILRAICREDEKTENILSELVTSIEL